MGHDLGNHDHHLCVRWFVCGAVLCGVCMTDAHASAHWYSFLAAAEKAEYARSVELSKVVLADLKRIPAHEVSGHYQKLHVLSRFYPALISATTARRLCGLLAC